MQFAVKIPPTMRARTGAIFRQADLATAVGDLDRRRGARGEQGFHADPIPYGCGYRNVAPLRPPRAVQ
jgi:hypothetical protein